MGPVKTEPNPVVLDDLERLRALRDNVESMIVKAVTEARRKGVSWYDIGPALGVTRQAATEKYKRKVGR